MGEAQREGGRTGEPVGCAPAKVLLKCCHRDEVQVRAEGPAVVTGQLGEVRAPSSGAHGGPFSDGTTDPWAVRAARAHCTTQPGPLLEDGLPGWCPAPRLAGPGSPHRRSAPVRPGRGAPVICLQQL